VDDWEDAVFDWQPEELNLKDEHRVAIHSIKQLRPLVSGQPWGIFFVDFDKGSLPIVVLRRVLNGLVPKSRTSSGGHQSWHARDLLFVASFGEAGAREIALAHFTDESDLGDLPTLRVLGWDESDTGLELGYVAQILKSKLRWPLHTAGAADQAAWRKQWASAFTLGYRQPINDSKTLALALAELAKRIRSRANAVLALESPKGHLTQLHKAFKENLIADLTPDGFADMFAQTITYGLFTAHASRGSGALVADDVALMVPSTNPFLKELLHDFLSAAGRDRKKAVGLTLTSWASTTWSPPCAGYPWTRCCATSANKNRATTRSSISTKAFSKPTTKPCAPSVGCSTHLRRWCSSL